LEQARTYRASGQWDEAVETLRQVMADSGDRLVRLDAERHCTLREYVQRLLANYDEAALALYRDRVDAQAERWYREAIATRDSRQLRALIDELYHSRWTDEALWAWGELALERGDATGARAVWEQLIPETTPGEEGPAARLACRQSDIPLAEVRARLVLASIFEGDLPRAEREWAAYRELHPQTRGRLAGREVDFAEALGAILQSAQDWPRPSAVDSWSTFAGDAARGARQSGGFEIGALAWKRDLDPTPPVDAALYRSTGYRPRRVAEDPGPLLSYHPVPYQDLVLVAGPRGISAFRAATGEPAWSREQALIYQDSEEETGRRAGRSALGVARYTLTVSGSRLYARLGSPVTVDAADGAAGHRPGYLVCLDLAAEGKLLWKIAPPGEGWNFEGTPLARGDAIYVGLRRRDVKPQAHVACYDAQTGQQRWTRFICAASTPAARQQAEECTHQLLTLVHDTLYYNTSLGAVVALSVHDGRIRWLTEYPRGLTSGLSRSAAHLYRDLTPCMYHRGRIVVAPADSEAIVALDAADGRVLWATQYPSDAVHLLGVGGDQVIASGDRLWWIHLDSGKITAQWPDGPSPQGYGRGLIVDDSVYWPTREEIHVFEAASGAHQRVIPITSRWPEITTGNLLLVGELVLMATANKVGGNQLVAFQRQNRHEPAALPLTFQPPQTWPHVLPGNRGAMLPLSTRQAQNHSLSSVTGNSIDRSGAATFFPPSSR
jgi:outer membrane protein assembly factor BamB